MKIIELLDLLRQILWVLESQSKPKLWKIDDIANYFDMSRATIEQKIISCDGFPKPFSVNNTHPRWIPEEVIKWVERKK